MKPSSRFPVLLMICLLFWRVPAGADERESFEAILRQSTKTYGLDFRLRKSPPDWEGLRTPAGMAVLVHDLMFTDNKTMAEETRRELCNILLPRATFPKSTLATYIMEKVKVSADDANLMARYMGFLDEAECSEEPGVITFWASHLSDTRNVERKPRHPESQVGEYFRVCDTANGCLRRYLRKHKLWMPGDPGYGDAGGETMWEARNRGIEALNGVLLKNKLITVAVSPAGGNTAQPPEQREQPDSAGGDAPGTKAPVVPAKPRTEPSTDSFWWLWVGGALAVTSLGCLFFRRGK